MISTSTRSLYFRNNKSENKFINCPTGGETCARCFGVYWSVVQLAQVGQMFIDDLMDLEDEVHS